MNGAKVLFFFLLIASGAALTAAICIFRPAVPLDSSLAPAYQLFGHASKGADRALAVLMRVDDLDEKRYGEAIAAECDAYADASDPDYIYVNAVMKDVAKFARKPFVYRVYMHESDEPNAFALPGGVIFVTSGLLSTIHSQSELAAVLAHETGHVELSHCLDAVKFQLAAQKIGAKPLGELADFAMSLLVRHSFSKTQEDDADTYAYELLTLSSYDPFAEGRAYASFISWCTANGIREERHAGVIRDYFLSHPPLAIRADKFTQKAERWREGHRNEKRYIGISNLVRRKAEFSGREWTK